MFKITPNTYKALKIGLAMGEGINGKNKELFEMLEPIKATDYIHYLPEDVMDTYKLNIILSIRNSLEFYLPTLDVESKREMWSEWCALVRSYGVKENPDDYMIGE